MSAKEQTHSKLDDDGGHHASGDSEAVDTENTPESPLPRGVVIDKTGTLSQHTTPARRVVAKDDLARLQRAMGNPFGDSEEHHVAAIAKELVPSVHAVPQPQQQWTQLEMMTDAEEAALIKATDDAVHTRMTEKHHEALVGGITKHRRALAEHTAHIVKLMPRIKMLCKDAHTALTNVHESARLLNVLTSKNIALFHEGSDDDLTNTVHAVDNAEKHMVSLQQDVANMLNWRTPTYRGKGKAPASS